MRLQVLFQMSPIAPAIIIYIAGGGLHLSVATCICLFFLQFVLLDEEKQNTSQIHVLFDPKDVLVDIVAVQGLGSAYPHTWMGKRKAKGRQAKFSLSKPEVEKVMWLEEYLPKDFPTARIMAFEYNSKWLFNADFMGLDDHATALLDALVKQRQTSPGRPILFIGHSYGGLVVKKTLILSHKSKTDSFDPRQEITDVESCIAFLGTPHQGSNHALFARVLSFIYRPFGGTYGYVLELLSDNDRLIELDRDFRDALSEGGTKQTICFYETKAQAWSWPLGPIVTRTSACLGQGREAAMECNHNEMNKFIDHDGRYQSFIDNLQRVYNPLANPVANDVSKDKLRKMLSGRITNGSAYSSTEIGGCTTGTREIIMEEIVDWACSPTGGKVYWLVGMAGTGKTTIAYTLCERLKDEGILGASFFCSTTEDQTHNMLSVFPTIAYALGTHSQRIADALLGSLKDKDVADMNLRDTFTTLISSPVSLDNSPFRGKTRVIVLDGFDQVRDRDRVEAIISLILGHVHEVALKFFISSRPLSNKFKDPQLQRIDLYNRPSQEVRQDIRLYVQRRLKELAARLGDEGMGWPTEEEVDAVVECASPLFIYAATVCSYVGEEDDDQIKRRLRAVIDRAPVKGSTRLPTDKLYALYAQITDAAYKKSNEDVDEVLGFITVARDHLSVRAIASLLFPDDGAEGESRISAALNALRSVLSVPIDRNEGVKVIHASFPDFLTDPAHSGETYYQSPSECHRKLGTSCLSLMEKLLDRDDIGGPQDPDTSLGDVRKGTNISGALEYSCVHWISHVVELYSLKLESAKELEADVVSFFETRVLRWLAHMSVLGKLSHAVGSLRKLELHSQVSASIRRASMEARRLTSLSYSHLEDYPLQVYYSAVMRIPKKSDIAKRFHKDWSWEVTSGLAEDWERCEGVLKVGQVVWSVVFSNDGRMVAAHTGGEIRICDVEELKGLSVLKPPEYPTCIALSGDGKSVAAGSKGGIHVWDVETKNERVRDIREETISRIAFIDQDREVIYGSNNSIYRYSVKSNKRLADIKLEPEGQLLSFSRDGKKAISKGQNNIYVVNTETGVTMSTLNIVRPHVDAAAFSRDGKRIVVSGLYDETVRIFEIQSGNEETQLVGHNFGVTSVAFSGDDQRIVTGSFDNSVRVWNVLDGKEEMKLVGHPNVSRSVAYSGDGLRVASGSDDGTLRIWSVEPGLEEERRREGRYTVTALALSSDGQKVFYARRDSNQIRIRNVDNGEDERPLIIGRDYDHIHTVAISKDGKHAAIATAGSKLLDIYNVDYSRYFPATGMFGHKDVISSVAFSPDDRKVASGSRDKTIRIWDRRTRKEEKKLEGHENSVCSVSFSSDGSKLVSGSSDHTIRIWDLETEGVMMKTLRGHTGPVLSVAFSSNSQKVLSGSHDKTVRIWDVETGEVERQWVHEGSIWSVAFSLSNSKIVSGCNNHTIYVWDLERGKVTTLEGHTDAVLSVAFSSDQQKVVSGSHDKTVRIWDLETGKEVQTITRHMDSVQLVTFPKDDTVFSASYDSTFRAWDVRTGKERIQMVGFINWMSSIALSSDNRLLAVGMNNFMIRIWNMETGDERILRGHTDKVTSIVFSYNNEKILSVSDDRTVRIWSVEKREQEKKSNTGKKMLSTTLSPDSKIVALLDGNGVISFWNVETGAMEKKFQGRHTYGSSMSFIDDTHFLVWSRGGIQIWNMETGQEEERMPDTANVPVLAYKGWIYSPSISAIKTRCWFPLDGVSTVVSNASGVVFALELGGVIVVKFKQSMLREQQSIFQTR
ncbi:hypothetical protein FRC20_003536 [Serendipita sp. 405]|nr:hypothetical protein FRC20_003536 [Serendipita sp. 405]